MFDDAPIVLEEIAPEDKTRNEVLGARVNLYMVAKKWDMAATVASHLLKFQPENVGPEIISYSLSTAERLIWIALFTFAPGTEPLSSNTRPSEIRYDIKSCYDHSMPIQTFQKIATLIIMSGNLIHSVCNQSRRHY